MNFADRSCRTEQPTTTHRARLLPFDATRHEQKINLSIFRRSRIVVESQL